MRKICEIDAIRVYEQTGVFAHLGHSTYIRKPNTRNAHRHDEFLRAAFTPAQLNFIQNRTTVFRPHPGHSPTIEVFVNKLRLSERDYTLIGLLF